VPPDKCPGTTIIISPSIPVQPLWRSYIYTLHLKSVHGEKHTGKQSNQQKNEVNIFWTSQLHQRPQPAGLKTDLMIGKY
jgi:hypothetical protein